MKFSLFSPDCTTHSNRRENWKANVDTIHTVTTTHVLYDPPTCSPLGGFSPSYRRTCWIWPGPCQACQSQFQAPELPTVPPRRHAPFQQIEKPLGREPASFLPTSSSQTGCHFLQRPKVTVHHKPTIVIFKLWFKLRLYFFKKGGR